MKQLTLRGLDDELSESIRSLAKREGTSLNQAALKLLRKGAELSDGGLDTGTVGSSLDHLIGTWSLDEADQFESALRDFEKIDESLWK